MNLRNLQPDAAPESCLQAKWLYQGWAIRGWNDDAGARRLKALHDVVPHGQWIPLDMDVRGIWRYWGNYSFFGAPFIWTTLHNMGGNDGLKGDMRMLEAMPRDALAAGASIVGVGATPEGINQNPPYYEYTFDAAWHTSPQPLPSWFETYAARRYGSVAPAPANPDAAAAWATLSEAVYTHQAGGWHDGTAVEWNPAAAAPKVFHGPDAIDVPGVFKAWGLLVSAGKGIDPEAVATFNYDLIDVGREALAQVISVLSHNMYSWLGLDL